jgi:hypothetical protein
MNEGYKHRIVISRYSLHAREEKRRIEKKRAKNRQQARTHASKSQKLQESLKKKIKMLKGGGKMEQGVVSAFRAGLGFFLLSL